MVRFMVRTTSNSKSSSQLKFVILTHVVHKKIGNTYYAYGPYIREMNIWLKYVGNVILVAPFDQTSPPEANELPYETYKIEFIRVPQFEITNFHSTLKTLLFLPLIIAQIVRGIKSADHIHIRCPGNVGLVGSFVQIFFPRKKKTAKYAGNWDWASEQPWSYRLQQCILRNTFLTRNMTTLVYGEWSDKSRNLKPFFTASFSENERLPIYKTSLIEGVKLAFAGTLTENKNPLACAEVLHALTEIGIKATLTYCGDGPERAKIEEFISSNHLLDRVKLLGNVDSITVKYVLQEAHFLILLSRSEGWPKAVSEAMWWGCVPVTTAVSCVPWMLDGGSRGELVSGSVSEITSIIEEYIPEQARFDEKSANAMKWARQYTLEKFDEEIQSLIH